MPTENNNVVDFNPISETITQPVTTPSTSGINTNTLVGGGVCAVAGAAILFVGERAWKWGKKLIAKHKAAKKAEAEDVAEYVDGEIVEEEKSSDKSNKR